MGRAQRGGSSVLLAAALAATACSGGGSGGTTTVHALASKLGCSELELVTDESRAFGATGDGSCQFAGEKVHLLTFDTDSAQDRSIRIGKDFGQILVIGEGWTARVDSATTAEKVKGKLGGVVT